MVDRKKLHPELNARLTKILQVMDILGHPMIPTNGARTAEEQHQLYRQGRDLPGTIVTNADGYKKRSNHQTRADGFGYAVDCAFLDANGRPSWAEANPWQLYGLVGESLGLSWGGRWHSLVDRPHMELPE